MGWESIPFLLEKCRMSGRSRVERTKCEKQRAQECMGLPVLSGSARSAGNGSNRLVGDTLSFPFFNWRWFLYFLDLT